MENIRVGEPLERVAMDITGPFPITKFKNRYVLVLMDYFTKWVEAYPIPDMGSCTVARYFCKEFISRFGVPRIFLSDQGPCFEARLFQQLCDLFGIHKTRTSSYHPMTDGLVEKMNHTLKNVIASYIDEGQTDWDEWLPFALMAIRSSVQETTGMTPNKLMFGSLAKRIVHYNRLKIYVTPHPDRTLVKKPIISPPQRPLSSGEGSETEDMSNDESGNEEGVFDQQPQTPPSIPGRRRRLPPRRFRDYVFY
ncbi:unnamed protein product [Mytilus edulis]|uniref:Integrase catalytic domain-containing protein n=1 Tax=Mytilus edulis TaxID=6550 RepID=A0A8S3V8B2_MYTED|nr:unnamed protein product [Mytilus edulis]